jgi:radical SAM protein with 4Fe4S-binding SPASM domain
VTTYFLSALSAATGIWFLCWLLMRGWLHIENVIARSEDRHLSIVDRAEQITFSTSPTPCGQCRGVGMCHPSCGISRLDRWDNVG